MLINCIQALLGCQRQILAKHKVENFFRNKLPLRSMQVIFVGSQKIGYICLKEVLKLGYDVVAVFTFKPDPHETWEYSVDSIARQKGIPLFDESEFTVDSIRKLSPDAILVVGYRKIIPNETLEIPKQGIIALHASLLPKYRGQAPLNWAIINGENKTGITMFFMDEGIDTGDIIAQKETAIMPDETIVEIKERIIKLAGELIKEYMPLIEGGTAPRFKQPTEGTYGCRRIPSDSLIDWNKSAKEVYNLIRACEPSYAAYTYFNGKKLFILKASIYDGQTTYIGTLGQVGMVFKEDRSSLVVTGHGCIKVSVVKEEGGESVPASVYLKSSKIRLDGQKM